MFSSKFAYSFLLLLLTAIGFSQNKITVFGQLTIEEKAVPDALIELRVNQTSVFAMSDATGKYSFSEILAMQNDSLMLKVKYYGYKTFEKTLNNTAASNEINVALIQDEAIKLEEINVTTAQKIVNSARKSSYKIDQKSFIKNAKAAEALATLPNVHFNEQDQKAIVDGTLEAKIFIDGMEAMQNEIKNIDASLIDRIEVINNPSSAYGTEFTGAVINIVTKKKTEEFFMGSLAATGGIRNNYSLLDPAVSYKRGRLIIKSDVEFGSSIQNVGYTLFRTDNYGLFYQKNKSNTRSKRINSDTRININLSKKSDLTFTGSIYGYTFKSHANGYSTNDENAFDQFSKEGKNELNTLSFGGIYSYKLTESKHFYLKSAYSKYEKKDINTFFANDDFSEYYNIESTNKEFTVSADYEAEELEILKKKMVFYTDFKYINRNYSFSNTDFYIRQQVINGSVALDTDWTEAFSTEAAFTLENTTNENQSLHQNYTLLLPTLNALYHFKNKLDLKMGYSRKVLRPNASDLNDAILIIYPGAATQGNPNLDPQIRNYYSLGLSRPIRNNNISVKFYNESVNNAIANVYRTDGNLLIKTLENAAKFNSTGINFGIRTELFKKINTNLNSGFDYNIFEDNSPSAIIKKNSGYTFRAAVSLGTKVYKDKVSLSISGNQNGPNYSLLSKTITNPYLDFTIKTNLFKDKLNIALYGQNILQKAANRSEINNYANFYQRIDSKNNTANLLLTLTYSFGKTFNDEINENNIQNDDIRKIN